MGMLFNSAEENLEDQYINQIEQQYSSVLYWKQRCEQAEHCLNIVFKTPNQSAEYIIQVEKLEKLQQSESKYK